MSSFKSNRLALLTTLLLPTALFAAPFGSGSSHDGWGPGYHGSGGKAVYFLRVDPAGSSVVGIEVGSNGLLTDSTSSTSTGGVGLQSLNASANDAVVMLDPLQGQDSVSIGEDYLFTVNSGSKTAVMFSIDPANPLHLEMVGEPAATLGEFPMSIAYSSKYQKACVLNGGAVNGVTCYKVDRNMGLIPDGVGLRDFGFDFVTPPVLGGPKGSGSDIQFTGNSEKLIAVLKGDTTPMTLGHVAVFDVGSDGDVAKTCVDNMIEPLQGPFGFALDGENLERLFISAVNIGGGATVNLDYETNQISLVGYVNNSAYAASCWAAYSYSTNLFYVINAGSANIGKIDTNSGLSDGTIDYTATVGGGVDTVVAGTTAYFLAAAENAVAVIDLANGDMLQQKKYSTPDNRPFWTGMAMYPANPLLSGGVGGRGGQW